MIKSKIFFIAISILLSTLNTQAQQFFGKQKEINKILKSIENFSQFYMNADYENLAAAYTLDGKIFPNNTDIIEGREKIKIRWTLPENVKILKHKITPLEINIIKKTAYDYGYYEGTTQRADGSTVSWKGKYVIVWKRVDGEWKIYLDIWNRINE